jgi:hypothetical protein
VSVLHSDVAIKAGTRAEEFAAHKAVLSARLSVFKAIFAHGLVESKSNDVVLDDMDPAIVGAMLKSVRSGLLTLALTQRNFLRAGLCTVASASCARTSGM